jgi:hypothetical protein
MSNSDMSKSRSLHIAAIIVATLILAVAANAKDNPEYTHIGRTINIDADQQAGDVTCVACNIYIRGQVSGDVTTLGGNIFMEDHGQVGGDVTAVAGSLRLDSTAKIGGDATVVGGEMRRVVGAEVGGDVTHVGGFGWAWLLLIFVLPLAVLGGIIMLIIWIVRRLTVPRVSATA